MSRRSARKRIGFSIDSVAERKRRLKRSVVSSSSFALRSSTDSSRISLAFTLHLLAPDEARLDRQLRGGERQRLLGQVFADALDLEHHAARLDHGHPALR